MSEKIYCIQCGREIKEGLLYCDRCGQSVAKSREQQSRNKSNRRQAEQLHREQINRKKRREAKEIKKQVKRRKARRRAAAILILGIVCASGAYVYMTKNSSIKSMDEVVSENTAQSSPAAQTSGQNTVSSSGGYTGMGFRMLEHNGIYCPYPESFTQTTPSGGELIKLEDAPGGAVMTITEEKASGDARDMMTAYYDSVSALGSVTENRSGTNWYIVSYETDSRVRHRKCVVTSNGALCYDFEYDKTSGSADAYQSCIANLDAEFTGGQDSQ